ncbi:Peptidase propeptide and YPEB domain-containing protein [Roseivivax marinus]|uniref:PepSY domain-containing protein n=1 Tax=Roseivivax marinus TaxID=1379903 RepID=UPI0008BED286|nr:PepSY domain-containing protein [Roseivivax marinus]SEL03624.1 Peptidase propeptide and YPEB domain-containing protein [Roseivivax marinus]
MTRRILIALPLALAPGLAFAMPSVGDVVGTNPEDATAALAEAGCTVNEFEAEDGQIEAKCIDAEKVRHEVYIDPKSGAVTKIKTGD